MKATTKGLAVALAGGAFFFTAAARAPAGPSGLRDAPGAESALEEAGLDRAHEELGVPEPVREKAAGNFFGNAYQWLADTLAGRPAADRLLAKFAKEGYGDEPYAIISKLFETGVAASDGDLAPGWHIGCRVEKKQRYAALLVTKPAAGPPGKRVILAGIDAVPSFAGLDHFEKITPELLKKERGLDYVYKIGMPAAEVKEYRSTGSLFFRMEYRKAGGVLIEKIIPYLQDGRESPIINYSFYYKAVMPE